MIVRHIDAKTAFLNGNLEQSIYMRQPPGFEVDNQKNLVCRLKKGIYGLKQSAKLWNDEIHKVLEYDRKNMPWVDNFIRLSIELEKQSKDPREKA